MILTFQDICCKSIIWSSDNFSYVKYQKFRHRKINYKYIKHIHALRVLEKKESVP